MTEHYHVGMGPTPPALAAVVAAPSLRVENEGRQQGLCSPRCCACWLAVHVGLLCVLRVHACLMCYFVRLAGMRPRGDKCVDEAILMQNKRPRLHANSALHGALQMFI